MEHGTKVANICYEYFEQGEKKHRTIGGLFYFRNHSGGCPSAQLRLDVVPAIAWKENPECYFIGNFIESEKIPEAPYICGKIYAPSDERGKRTYIGHIATRETNDGKRVQFYMQLFGLPMREINKGIKKAFVGEVMEIIDDLDDVMWSHASLKQMLHHALTKNKKHSLYLGIEIEG